MIAFLLLSIALYTPAMIGMHQLNTVIVEIDDVLFEPNPSRGHANYVWLTKYLNNAAVESAQKKLIELTAGIDLSALSSEIPHQPTFATLPTFRNLTLPYLWCLYLTGYVSSGQMLNIIKNHVSAHTYLMEKSLLNLAAETAFNPEAEAAIMTPKDNLIKIIQNLEAVKTNQLFILANKNRETLHYLRMQFPHIFTLFKDVIVSGVSHHLKPNQQAYEHVLQTHAINPATCYAIESQQSYAEPVRKLGITPIIYDGDDEKLTKTLQNYHLID